MAQSTNERTRPEVGYFCPQTSSTILSPPGPGFTPVPLNGTFVIRWKTNGIWDGNGDGTGDGNGTGTGGFDEDIQVSIRPLFHRGKNRYHETPVTAILGTVPASSGRFEWNVDPQRIPSGNYTVELATSQSDWFFFSYPIQVCDF